VELLAFDNETLPFRKGLAAPPMVCMGWSHLREGEVLAKGLITKRGEFFGDLPSNLVGKVSFANALRAFAAYARMLGPDNCRIVNLNIVYDFGVLCADDEELIDLIFDLYDEGFIEDPGLREQLLDIAAGSLGWSTKRRTAKGTSRPKDYSLAEGVLEYFGEDLDKVSWRMGYGKLLHVPLEQWPQGAIDYGIDDSVWAGLMWFAQRDKALEEGSEDGEVPDSRNQAKYHWGLHLTSVWGIRTDPKRVFTFKAMLQRTKATLQQVLQQVYVDIYDPAFAEAQAQCEHSWRQNKQGLRKCPHCGARSEPFIRANGKKVMASIKSAVMQLSSSKGVIPELTKTGLKKAKSDELTEENLIQYVSTKADHIEDMLKLFDVEVPQDMGAAMTMGQKILSGEQTPDLFDGLTVLAWFMNADKLLGTYMPWLEQGTRLPVNARYRPLVETGRASCAKPNMMNLPKAPGVRECYIPRPGFLFCSVDYEALELHTLAQVCLTMLGESALAEALNNGLDPHLLLAVEWLIGGDKLSYDEAKAIRKDKNHARHDEVVKARNVAKAANFGLGGGLGAKKFVDFCKSSGIYLSLEDAQHLKEAWFKQWPEMRLYFKHIKGLLHIPDDAVENEDGELPSYVTVEQVFSERIRGKTRYTAACNSYFQGLAADGAKLAVYELSKQCYRSDGTLRGSRMVVFVHDETILEHPVISREDMHFRCFEQARIMTTCMETFTPDIRSKAVPALMDRWDKSATDEYDEDGFIQVYQPREAHA